MRTEREKILEMIKLMGNEEAPNVIREMYHDRALVMLEDYQGRDFDKLMNKYLTIEWRGK